MPCHALKQDPKAMPAGVPNSSFYVENLMNYGMSAGLFLPFHPALSPSFLYSSLLAEVVASGRASIEINQLDLHFSSALRKHYFLTYRIITF
jgi:hypothetical protein